MCVVDCKGEQLQGHFICGTGSSVDFEGLP